MRKPRPADAPPRRKALHVRPAKHNRQGPTTPNEKDLVAAFVMDQPGPVTDWQENALAVALRRTPAVVKKLIQDARENFAAKAGRYVEIHAEATEKALSSGTVNGLETALRGSQWAIERIAEDGARVVDKATEAPQGSKIMIGIDMGNIRTPGVLVEAK